MGELASAHLDGLTGVQKATIDQYRGYFIRDSEPVLDHLPVSAVTRVGVGKWGQSLSGSGKTIANKHGFLSSSSKRLYAIVESPRIPM